MNTHSLLARLSVTTLAFVALGAAAGCSASVDEEPAAESADAVTVHAQRNAGWCTSNERTLFNCVMGAGEQRKKVDGYFVSVCAKDGRVQLRHGNVNHDVEGQIQRFALPQQPTAANSCATGKASSREGGVGRYLHISGDSGTQGYVFEMGRTAPSTTGTEIGETVSGVAFEYQGQTERVIYCSGEPLVALTTAGVPPTGKPWTNEDVWF